ncbi:hypothetical protein [Cellulomonas composti]|uniref:Uncharacterized protein n=1 Tax=Cellulomonas composti TaxID=266130 RepID=A0A511J7I6_9CELL|nr:hypothetical protein [Cellulomonas composti]GEL93950.1 hypothetical protein CCO02nite_06080 [Cellulomonas composti]
MTDERRLTPGRRRAFVVVVWLVAVLLGGIALGVLALAATDSMGPGAGALAVVLVVAAAVAVLCAVSVTAPRAGGRWLDDLVPTAFVVAVGGILAIVVAALVGEGGALALLVAALPAGLTVVVLALTCRPFRRALREVATTS